MKRLAPSGRVAWIASPRPLAVVLGALLSFGLCLGLPLGPLQFGGVAHAQAKSARGQAKALIVRRFTLVKHQDLSFGNILARGQAGTVSINPFTDARTATGVSLVGGTAHAARFVGAGTPNGYAMVSWRVAPPYTLRRVGGTETMTVDQLTANAILYNGAGWDFRQVPANGLLDIRIGGRLQVAANQTPGDYQGQFEITVDYY